MGAPTQRLAGEWFRQRFGNPCVDGVRSFEELFEARSLVFDTLCSCWGGSGRGLAVTCVGGLSSRANPRFRCGFAGVTGCAKRLEVLVVMGTPVDQRDDVIEFPERLPRLVAAFANCPSSTATDLSQLSSYLVRIDATVCAASAIPLANPPARFAGVARVVDVDTGLVPAATSIDAAFVFPGVEEDLLATPAAGSLRCIAPANFRSSMGRHTAVRPQ